MMTITKRAKRPPFHIRFSRKVDVVATDKKTDPIYSVNGKSDSLKEMEHKLEPEEFEHKFDQSEFDPKIPDYRPYGQKNDKFIGNELILSKYDQMTGDDRDDNIAIYYQ